MHTHAPQHDDSHGSASSQSGVTNCKSIGYLGGGKTHPVKSSILSQLIRAAAALCLLALLALANTSCTNLEKLEDPELLNSVLAKIELYGTDFSTSSSIPIDIQAGHKQFIRIYAGDPSKGSVPEVSAFFTDSNGNYHGNITIANIHLGTMLYAVGSDYSAVATASATSTVFYSSVESELSRTESNFTNTIENKTWCDNQREYFFKYLPEKTDNSAKLSADKNNDLVVQKDCTIKIAFLYSGAANYSQLYYYYYPTSGTAPTASTVSNFINFNSVSCDTTFQVFYNSGISGTSNEWNDYTWFGIQDEARTGIDNNTVYYQGTKGLINYVSKSKYEADNSGAYRNNIYFYGAALNETAQLKMKKGYSVGFALRTYGTYKGNPAYNGESAGNTWPVTSIPIVYSNNSLNTDSESPVTNTQVSRFLSTTSATDGDNAIIMGFEDITKAMMIRYQGTVVNEYNENEDSYPSSEWAKMNPDWDYNDLIIAVASDPADGIITSGDDPLPDEEEKIGAPTCGTLLFEDLYPEQGDYDMNDVMVKYSITPYIKSIGDYAYITRLVCRFFPYCDGAQYTNDLHLAINFPTSYNRTNIDKEIYVNNRSSLGKEYTVEIEFNDGTDDNPSYYFLQSDYIGKEKDVLDPFIYVQGTTYEVHLTGKSATGTTGRMTVENDDNYTDLEKGVLKQYYATEEGTNFEPLKFPFAMDIADLNDRVAGHESDGQFYPSPERKRIDTEIGSDYTNWVNGDTSENSRKWYRNHVSTGYSGVADYYITYPSYETHGVSGD